MANHNLFSQNNGFFCHNSNPDHDYDHLSYTSYNNSISSPNLENSDYMFGLEAEVFNEIPTDDSFIASVWQNPFGQDVTSTGSSASDSSNGGMQMNRNNNTWETEESMKSEGNVVTIRTMTSLENLDDGYKWRKYGKKMVKTNPNPRHYYKCLSKGCKIKKQVQRDGDDSRFLMVTYINGKHNHEAKCLVYQEQPSNGGLSTPATLKPSTLIIRSSSI